MVDFVGGVDVISSYEWERPNKLLDLLLSNKISFRSCGLATMPEVHERATNSTRLFQSNAMAYFPSCIRGLRRGPRRTDLLTADSLTASACKSVKDSRSSPFSIRSRRQPLASTERNLVPACVGLSWNVLNGPRPCHKNCSR